MKQTMVSENGSSLLDYAVSSLSPEVFLHPVWLRFGRKDAFTSFKIVDDLLRVATNLQKDDPGTTCQILLICAVYQNYAGQRFDALKTLQQALVLAQNSNLYKEAIWTIWGICAIAVQQGNFEQACGNLVDLQAALSKQNEWILADFIDVLRQAFAQPGIVGAGKPLQSPRNQTFEEVLAFTLDWFQHWGFSTRAYTSQFELTAKYSVDRTSNQSALTQSFFSIQHWQGRWHTLLLAMRGELRVQWRENDRASNDRKPSFWESILSSLHHDLSNENIDTQITDDRPALPNVVLMPPVAQNSPREAEMGTSKQIVKNALVTQNELAEQVRPVTPVVVHMLGAFSMVIGDMPLKLPASRGLSLLKYLLLHHKQSTPREVLMDIFWPEAEPELARNNLNVAMHNLRKSLFNVTDLPVIVYENGLYSLPSDLDVWLDAEEFERCVKTGKRLEALDQFPAAVAEYETAISLYQGDFLEQNPYDEWTILERERLRIAYLDTLDRLSQIYFSQEHYAACITVCQLIVIADRCREDAHCLLMRCYSHQGQTHLALRQFQTCLEALRDELDVEPGPATTQLAERIRRRERV